MGGLKETFSLKARFRGIFLKLLLRIRFDWNSTMRIATGTIVRWNGSEKSNRLPHPDPGHVSDAAQLPIPQFTCLAPHPLAISYWMCRRRLVGFRRRLTWIQAPERKRTLNPVCLVHNKYPKRTHRMPVGSVIRVWVCVVGKTSDQHICCSSHNRWENSLNFIIPFSHIFDMPQSPCMSPSHRHRIASNIDDTSPSPFWREKRLAIEWTAKGGGGDGGMKKKEMKTKIRKYPWIFVLTHTSTHPHSMKMRWK